MSTAWYNSTTLVEAIQRKISMPLSQNTFSDDDMLKFANEEMMISQVPSVLKYHQEYFVYRSTVPLISNKTKYEIPNRAIGMKLRDVFWEDNQGNLQEMTRISSDDRAFFQRNVGANTAISKFYVEGNFIVLTPLVQESPTGSLLMLYYLRPNQLVTVDRAATVTNFAKTITIDNSNIFNGDTITIGSVILTLGTDFAIGVSSTATAANLVSAISGNGTYSASNSSSSIVQVNYTDISVAFSTSNSVGFTIQVSQGIQFDAIPTNITNLSYIDFLQTDSGHRTKALDVLIPSNSISGTIINFDSDDVPDDLIVGDYICSATECIIPQIPTDLHNGLAERTAARILASIGDSQGLEMSNAKIQDISKSEGPLLDARVEGAPLKVLNRYSLARLGQMGPIRKY